MFQAPKTAVPELLGACGVGGGSKEEHCQRHVDIVRGDDEVPGPGLDHLVVQVDGELEVSLGQVAQVPLEIRVRGLNLHQNQQQRHEHCSWSACWTQFCRLFPLLSSLGRVRRVLNCFRYSRPAMVGWRWRQVV